MAKVHPAVCNAWRAAYTTIPADAQAAVWKDMVDGGCDISGLTPPAGAQQPQENSK